VDHVNDHGSFTDPIRQTNLCVEITLPTRPMAYPTPEELGEISLCTLAAVNWGKIREPSDFARPCDLLVRALNELLDYQDYPVEAARASTMARRPLGIGIINLAYWMAREGITYQGVDEAGLSRLHAYAEAWSYYLIKSSCDLATERGLQVLGSKYTDGTVPIDTYKRTVDDLVAPTYAYDWDQLRRDLKAKGIANSTLMAQMPAETSAQVSNSTNGIEPPRALVSIKQSKDGVLKQVVPDIKRLKRKYDLLWDQKSPAGYLKICAVLQKFMDQSISVNTSYDPRNYPDGKIPMSVLLGDMLTFYKYGGKSLYYFNTNDGAGEVEATPVAVEET
ncbi:MAG: ribonucleotide-diphosphate reductase subunit alpha, partial [Thaumarchaeota archaeon]|nr:ribonucleotide-diphosphate reductase subunit alpha [Nitrososphaerota archaeon]